MRKKADSLSFGYQYGLLFCLIMCSPNAYERAMLQVIDKVEYRGTTHKASEYKLYEYNGPKDLKLKGSIHAMKLQWRKKRNIEYQK